MSWVQFPEQPYLMMYSVLLRLSLHSYPSPTLAFATPRLLGCPIISHISIVSLSRYARLSFSPVLAFRLFLALGRPPQSVGAVSVGVGFRRIVMLRCGARSKTAHARMRMQFKYCMPTPNHLGCLV